MANEAKIQIEGNVARDPELRQAGGKPVVGVTVLQTGRRKQQDGSWGDGETVAYECTLWDEEAEYAVASLPKGTAVVVLGRVVGIDTYESQGETRAKVKVAVENIGPSLKRATAQVSRRTRGQGGHQSGSWGDQAAQEAPGQGWATSEPGQAQQPAWGAPGASYGESTPF